MARWNPKYFALPTETMWAMSDNFMPILQETLTIGAVDEIGQIQNGDLKDHKNMDAGKL